MALANSIKSKDLGALEAALEKANEVGLSAHPEVASATESKDTLLKEVAADEALAAAMATAAAAPGDEAATTALRRCASLFLCVCVREGTGLLLSLLVYCIIRSSRLFPLLVSVSRIPALTFNHHHSLYYASSAYDAAAGLGLTTDRMMQARVTLDRDQLVADTETKVRRRTAKRWLRYVVALEPGMVE